MIHVASLSSVCMKFFNLCSVDSNIMMTVKLDTSLTDEQICLQEIKAFSRSWDMVHN